MPSPLLVPIQSGLESWDAAVDDNFDVLGKMGNPVPIPEWAGGNETTLPAASAYDNCWIWVVHSTLGRTLAYSDGSAWKYLTAAAQADSTAVDVAGLKSDFNALLAKLRTAGTLKT